MEKTPTDMELAFREWAEPYTGMQGVDMEKCSHGRAFMAGWEARVKYDIKYDVTVTSNSENFPE